MPAVKYDALDALGPKVNADAAGYMELEGAVKDASCELVDVPKGVSSERGCCNLFDPKKGVERFSCGTCEYVHIGEENAGS